MTKKTRKILFFFFLVLFLFSAPVIILYSQGYRFDFEKKSLTKTGGLFLKVIPRQVEIYLNEKFVKKTDFFFGSAFIENLLPKKYKIQIRKEGYHPWEKVLEIKEKEVTEAKNIILFPVKLNFEILSKNVKNFWPSPDGKKIVLKEEISQEEPGWALKLYDLERGVKSHLISEKEIFAKGADFLDLNWSPDSKEIYLNVAIGEEEKHFKLDLNKIPPILVERKIVSPPENVIAYQNVNGDNYFLDNLGNLYLADSSFLVKEKINEKPFPIKEETKYELNIFSGFIFLREGETLYLFNPDSKLFEKLLEKINTLEVSPDNKKLALASDFEIWIFFLKEKMEQPTKKAGQNLFLLRLSEKIKDVFWLNSDYLIFNVGDKIKIVEIDERDKLNIVEIAEFKNAKIFFNQADKKLYVLAEEILYSSESILK